MESGGTALMELEPQAFVKMFAWLREKFGVDWQFICDKKKLYLCEDEKINVKIYQQS